MQCGFFKRHIWLYFLIKIPKHTPPQYMSVLCLNIYQMQQFHYNKMVYIFFTPILMP